MIVPNKFVRLQEAIGTQLEVFPRHRDYLERRFKERTEEEMVFADSLADLLLKVAQPSFREMCSDYRWLCTKFLEEEVHFRRTGNYRLSKFEEASRLVYSDREFMQKYMSGLLASQLWWHNHTEVLRYFVDAFLPANPNGFRHLEIGPGHGLFLHFALSVGGCSGATGWDISSTSLAETSNTLEKLGHDPKFYSLAQIDMREASEANFDSITFSEVLEHLEQPLAALRALARLLAPNGRIFINAPVNSPAPDHIYLFRTPQEIADLVGQAGFHIDETRNFPATGTTLERALAERLTISCAVIARKSAQ